MGSLRTRNDKTYKYRKGVEQQKYLYSLLNKFIKLYEKDSEIILDSDQERMLNKLWKLISDIPGVVKETDNIRDFALIFKNNLTFIKDYYPDYYYIKKGINISYGQDSKVANNIWKTINNPITEKMITTGEGITDEIVDDEKYYNRDINERRYNLTFCMQEFHNKIIKNNILIKSISDHLRLTE